MDQATTNRPLASPISPAASTSPLKRWAGWILVAATSLAVSAFLATPLPMNAGAQDYDGVLLDFTATWCGPCQQMSPMVERLAQEGFPVQKVDIDQQKDLAQQYNIRSIPTFVLVVRGQEVTRIVGATSEAQLRRLVLQIPATKSDAGTQLAGPRALPRSPSADSTGEIQLALGDSATFPGRGISFSDTPELPKNPVVEAREQEALAQQAAQNKPEKPAKRGLGFGSLFGGSPAPVTPPESTPPTVRGQSQDGANQDPLAASVRLRVKDKAGMNYGSGTVLESLPSRTIILTCGHVFRNLPEGEEFDVDVFDQSGEPETFRGQVLAFELDGDVGLLAIQTSRPLPTVKLAALTEPLKVGENLQGIGCGGGKLPSRENMRVTAINKYVGPDNIECSGEPEQGRSGGGLFRRTGELVGVCIAAEPVEKNGLYAGLQPIRDLLQKTQLTHLIPGSPAANRAEIADSNPGIPFADSAVTPPKSEASPRQDQVAEALANSALQSGLRTDPAALGKLMGGDSAAEVICIVRSPDGPSRVVVVNQASSKFLNYLLDEVEPGE